MTEVGRTNPLPVLDCLPYPDLIEIGASYSGAAALDIPTGAMYVEILSIDAEIWYTLGQNTALAAPVPPVARAATTPRYIGAKQFMVHDVRELAKINLVTTGRYSLSWWLE